MNIRSGQRVEVSKYSLNEAKRHYDLVPDGEATFCDWGVSFEEFESGPGNYSTAIIVRDNGKVENLSVEMIKFIDETLFAKDTAYDKI